MLFVARLRVLLVTFNFDSVFSFFIDELFAVLDESERLLGEIDALTKDKQQKVSPMLGFMSVYSNC